MKNLKKPFIYFVIIMLFFTWISYTYSANDQSTAYDFSSPTKQASNMRLAGYSSEQEKEQPENEQSTNEQEDIERNEEQSESDNQKQDVNEEPQSQPVTKKLPQVVQKAKEQTADAPGANETSNNEEAPNHIEIGNDAEKENHYFSTNLIDGAVVTEPNFYVTLTHLDESLTMQKLDVYVNGKLLEGYNGELHFKEGKNAVKFVVTYENTASKKISVQQQYNITLNTNDIVIFSSLQNKTIEDSTIAFNAFAKLQKEQATVTVYVNGQQLKPLSGTAYKASLQAGKNDIVIEAQAEGKKASKQYEITYEEIQQVIKLETDLLEHRAANPNYSFYAKATAGNENVPLNVMFNDEHVTGDKQGQFAVQLKHGLNIINLQGSYQNEHLTKQYRIIYKDPTVVEEEKVDPQAPKLVTDLKDGIKVKGEIKTINVWPTTASGERIRGKNVLVKVNGVTVPFTWDDSTKTSYKLVLKEGENNVSIKVWDDDGRPVTENFVVHSEGVEDNGVIGQVTISLEASTLGIPYFISPTKMDIHKGEKGSYILDQFLRNHGFAYRHTGSLDNGFYLKSISKPGMLSTLNIPDDLWVLVEKYSTRAERNDYLVDNLGEFNFANGSGWMYSVNGDYPNYGVSDAYFLDGDVVRIRYTLHYGKDINGFGSMSGNNDEEWGKEW